MALFFTPRTETKKERRDVLGKERSKRKKGELLALANDYFDDYLATHEKEIPDVESFAVFLGTSREELLKESPDELGQILTRIAGIKKQLAMNGKIPASVFTFDFKNNHGYGEKTPYEQEGVVVTLKGKAPEWSS